MNSNPNVQTMMQYLQQEPQMLPMITRFLALPDSQRREWFRIMKQMVQEPNFNQLIKQLSKITPDPNVPARTREDTLDRISKYVETISRHDQQFIDPRTKRTLYRPKLKPYEMILVQFAGQGSEIHDIHFGITWDVQDNRDQVIVIPTNSFKYESSREHKLQFNIGKVGFLPEETLVKLVDICSISRKRILTNRLLDETTNQMGFIRLEPHQLKRIQYGLHAFVYGEPSLFDSIRKQDRIPVLMDYDTQIHHMHLSYQVQEGTTPKVLKYKVLGDNTVYEIHRKPTHLPKTERNKLLHQWINATGKDAMSRKRNQRNAYLHMIQQTVDRN